jgi:3-oxoadipate enol-lactonase
MSPAAQRGRSGRGSSDHGSQARTRRLRSISFDISGRAAVRRGGNGAAPLQPAAPPDELPPGRVVELPGRGDTWVHDAAGPPGAPTLILLHGWSATAAINWFTSFPTLAAAFRVVAMDHRGHGRGVRAGRFRLEDCADDVAALADALGIDRFVAVGYSMGGPIAQLTWRRHRDRVTGLVLCATSRNFRGTPVERALFSAIGGLSIAARVAPTPWSRELHTRFANRRYDNSQLGRWARDEIARNDPRSLVEAGHALGRYTSHQWIGEVDVPTAVVVTEQDAVVPPSRQRRLAESIPGALMLPVAGDHSACVMRTDLFVPALFRACIHASGIEWAGEPASGVEPAAGA